MSDFKSKADELRKVLNLGPDEPIHEMDIRDGELVVLNSDIPETPARSTHGMIDQLMADLAELSRLRERVRELEAELTFSQLRRANLARLPLFLNRRGELAHSRADGSDWSPAEWMCAVAGELGEAANLLKKVKRGDMSLDEARTELASEYADVVIYLDILAFQTGVDLGEATREKWNEVSERIGIPLRLTVIPAFDSSGDPSGVSK